MVYNQHLVFFESVNDEEKHGYVFDFDFDGFFERKLDNIDLLNENVSKIDYYYLIVMKLSMHLAHRDLLYSMY